MDKIEPVAPSGLSGIGIALWNTCRKRGMSQDAAIEFVRQAMAEPTMPLALAPAQHGAGAVEQAKEAILQVRSANARNFDQTGPQFDAYDMGVVDCYNALTAIERPEQ